MSQIEKPTKSQNSINSKKFAPKIAGMSFNGSSAENTVISGSGDIPVTDAERQRRLDRVLADPAAAATLKRVLSDKETAH